MAGARDQVLERQGFKPNQMIFQQGERGNVAYLVQSGEVEIFRVLSDGSEETLGTVGAGGIFGEMALLDSAPRVAAARACEETSVIVISDSAFRERLRKTDPFIRGLIRVLSDNVRRLAQRD